MLIEILSFLALGSCIQIINGEENDTLKFDFTWIADSEPQDPQFYILELNNTVVRASMILFPESSSDALSLKTIDPRDTSVSCIRWVPSRNVTFNKDYWHITNLENGKIVAMSSALDKVFIIDMARCDKETIDNQHGDIVPYDNSFDLVRFNEDCTGGDICLTRYDDQGLPMAEQINITINSGYTPLAAFSYKSNSTYSKYVVIRYTHSQCGFLFLKTCYETVVDLLSPKLYKSGSFSHKFYMETYSRAHNYLSLCGNGENGIECGILNLRRGLIKDIDLSGYYIYKKFVSVHNMKDGGMVLIFCSPSVQSSGCEMMYYVSDGLGRDLVKPTPVNGVNAARPVYADRDADPYFKPIVVEKDADNREYCFVIPGARVIEGKCLRIPTPI